MKILHSLLSSLIILCSADLLHHTSHRSPLPLHPLPTACHPASDWSSELVPSACHHYFHDDDDRAAYAAAQHRTPSSPAELRTLGLAALSFPVPSASTYSADLAQRIRDILEIGGGGQPPPPPSDAVRCSRALAAGVTPPADVPWSLLFAACRMPGALGLALAARADVDDDYDERPEVAAPPNPAGRATPLLGTGLWWAASVGSAGCARKLLDAGADVDRRVPVVATPYGRHEFAAVEDDLAGTWKTPLAAALANVRVPVVAEADVDVQVEAGERVERVDHAAVAAVLVELGATVGDADKRAAVASNVPAVLGGSAECWSAEDATLLLHVALGVSKDSEGQYAVNSDGRLANVRMLLDAGAEANSHLPGLCGLVCLDLAVQRGDVALVRALLAAGGLVSLALNLSFPMAPPVLEALDEAARAESALSSGGDDGGGGSMRGGAQTASFRM